ncbi:putative DnaJ domain-containing protein [Rosa chinensis]|uniref:Putative DnaJ domain-containing protein n=1 Tax=Rosa chinensis TaxID=74649 RepID=A0A2P6PED7_ROSCH|nr:putative DnaJ domain-containing protein [Rosa chinensis]
MGIDHYKILGVNRNASPDVVKKAYKKLVMFWHPDKHLQEEARAKVDAKFKEINQAYQILNDPVKQHNYDSQHANIANSNWTYDIVSLVSS